MNVYETINYINNELDSTENDLSLYFTLNETTLSLKDEGWSLFEILEHITLTNHFLLILIKKGEKKALKNINNLNLEDEIKDYRFDIKKFENIALPGVFNWDRPDHMVPKKSKSIPELMNIAKEQFQSCRDSLQALKNGEGLVYKTTMTVDHLGKINVYEYIYFLNQHIKRHITQMKRILYKNRNKSLDAADAASQHSIFL